MRSFIQYNKFVAKFRPNPKPEKFEKAPKKGLSYKRKNTGEKEIFLEIWDERPHFCQVTFEPLPEARPIFFLHVLPKAQNKYPKFKLKKENIILGSETTHYNWDHNRKAILNDPDYAWLFELEESLKEQYKKIVTK